MASDVPNVRDGWFTEAQLPNQNRQDIRISARVSEVLYSEESPFGIVQIFDTPFYGRMLALDGIVQVAEKDEFIYHEMMVTLPAIKHGKPKNILIIGGGDGGAVKQATRIPSAERIVLVEINQSVIDMSQKYMPSIAEGSLDDPRVEVVVADGNEYVAGTSEKFDIIALDLTDPIEDGPAAALFKQEFYAKLKNILNEGGYVSTHCGSLLFQPEEAKVLRQELAGVFGEVALHTAVVPTYQLTTFGFLIATDSPQTLSKAEITERVSGLKGPLKYLSPDMVLASAALPLYLADQT